MRKTLYFKDDDARLSFLLGNYVSLTNLSQEDIQRIIDMHISPINISVHATQPELRRMMLGNPRGADGYRTMRQLAAGGITMKCQIVLCPGVNDKENLEQTLTDLAALAPQVSSVSVVPVGLTRYREKLYPLRAVTKAEAHRVIETVDRFGQLCLDRGDSRVFFCADEMYLKAGLALPDAPYYEDYPQIENGVGMLTSFKDEFLSALKQEDAAGDSAAVSIATGMASLPFIQELIDALAQKRPKLTCHIYGIQNTFFGDTIDVSGLVTGGDIITQLQGKELGERLLIPDVMLRHDNDLFLDDVSLEEVEKELGVHVRPLPADGSAFLDELLGIE